MLTRTENALMRTPAAFVLCPSVDSARMAAVRHAWQRHSARIAARPPPPPLRSECSASQLSGSTLAVWSRPCRAATVSGRSFETSSLRTFWSTRMATSSCATLVRTDSRHCPECPHPRWGTLRAELWLGGRLQASQRRSGCSLVTKPNRTHMTIIPRPRPFHHTHMTIIHAIIFSTT